MIIKNAEVLCEDEYFRKRDIYIEGDRFSEFSVGEMIDAQNCYAIPGLIDLHFHGCVGVDFCDGTREALDKITYYQAHQGVTTVVPATMTYSEERLISIAQAVKAYREDQTTCMRSGYADLYGINMEGPFVSREKCGAQNPAFLHDPDYEMFKRINDAAGQSVRLCDIAPELPGAMPFIEKASEDCRISLAHTASDYDTAKQAFSMGAVHMTHLYNAMPAFSHRAPGPIGAAMDQGNVTVELICDGVHVNPTVIRATYKLFGKERVILISDSMRATGLPDGEYELGGQPVIVKGKLATLEDGTIAGSVTNLMNCLKYAVREVGLDLKDAVYSATVTPAKALGIYSEVGSISKGKLANLVLLDKETLETKAIILRGELVE